MRDVRFTPQARRDLLEIWEYIAKDSLDAADRVASAIEDAVRLLAELPGIGHTRTDVSDPRYRFWRVYSYLIAYRFGHGPDRDPRGAWSARYSWPAGAMIAAGTKDRPRAAGLH